MYGEITALSNKEGFCWATNTYFAELYGVSKFTVSRWISALVEKGFVKIELINKDNGKEVLRKLYIPIDEKRKGGINKNSKGNNTSINNTSNITKVMGISPIYGNSDINLIMETFEKSFGLKPNKIQANRRAAQRLKNKLKDTSKVCRLIEYAASIQGQRYSPTIGSVLDIEDKLIKLVAHSKQQTQEVYDAS